MAWRASDKNLKIVQSFVLPRRFENPKNDGFNRGETLYIMMRRVNQSRSMQIGSSTFRGATLAFLFNFLFNLPPAAAVQLGAAGLDGVARAAGQVMFALTVVAFLDNRSSRCFSFWISWLVDGGAAEELLAQKVCFAYSIFCAQWARTDRSLFYV